MKIRARRGVCIGVDRHLKAGDLADLDAAQVTFLVGIGAVEVVPAEPEDPAVVPEAEPDEKPLRHVFVPAFYIDRFEVTRLSYANPLRLVAENSGGRVQLHIETLPGCQFADDLIDNPDEGVMDVCPARKQHAVDYINNAKPQVVVVSNSYGQKTVGGNPISQEQWADSVQRILAKFKANTAKIVMLSAPPADVKISDCYGKRSSTPAECISKVTDQWHAMAETERGIADALGGAWVDSRQWFCSSRQLCPAFVDVTPTKFDAAHMSPAYGEKISPVIAEAFAAAAII